MNIIKQTLIIILISHYILFAQKIRIYGQVKDSLTAEPLIGVNIYLCDGKTGTVSDGDGYFYLSFENSQSDTFSVYFQYVGYKTKEQLISGTTSFLDVDLQPVSLELADSISVQANRFRNEIGLSYQSFQPLTVLNSAALGDADIFRFLATQSGISFSDDVSNRIYIRGMRSDKLLILLDDFALYNPYHLVNISSAVDVGSVKNIELYKSVYPVNQAGRTGGMLKLYTKQGNAHHFNLDFDVSLMSTVLRLQGPLGNASYFISLRRTYLDFLTKLVDEEFPYSFTDGVVNITFKPGKKHKIVLSGIASFDEFLANFKEHSRWSNQAYGFNWKYYPSPRLYFHTNVSYSHFRSSYNTDSLYTNNAINDLSYKTNLYYHFDFLKTTLNAGAAFHSYGISFQSAEELLEILNQDSRVNQYDLFINFNTTLSGRLKADLGLTLSHYLRFTRPQLLPLVRLQYLFSNSFKVATGYARKAQYLFTINNERDILPPFNIWRALDKDTGPEISRQLSFSASLKKPSLDMDLEIYYNFLERIVDYNRKYLNQEDALFLANQGESYGLEANLRYYYTLFDLELHYALSRTIYTMYGKPYYPSFHRLHKFDINLHSKSYKGWSGSLHWVAASGRPYTVTKGYYYLHHYIDMVSPTVFASPYYSVINSARYPAYHRLDLRINKRFSGHFKLYLNIINVYNQKNIFYYQFNEDKKSASPVYMLPFLPTLGAEFKW
ncbi:MAG TPA: hypothetical protein ENK44_09520 [Caldithrix abyssi]|uniref:TonB-dependent receptor n=1 Tax=Caldithrix abyssi TaxID=187145 RepID=A0A7V4U0U4_CALAY|nr:hypothetical protein [Caldithrix abyssi]